MSVLLEQLKATVVTLRPAERAELAHYLLDTLQRAEEETTEAWHEELRRRMADIRAGNVVGKPVEEVLNRLRELYP